MTPQLTPEQSAAFHSHDNKSMPVVDPATNHVYVVVDLGTHEQAMDALRERDDELSVQRGIDDMEAGRYSPADEAFAAHRRKFRSKVRRMSLRVVLTEGAQNRSSCLPFAVPDKMI